MNKKTKYIITGLGPAVALAAPVATLVSCNGDDNKSDESKLISAMPQVKYYIGLKDRYKGGKPVVQVEGSMRDFIHTAASWIKFKQNTYFAIEINGHKYEVNKGKDGHFSDALWTHLKDIRWNDGNPMLAGDFTKALIDAIIPAGKDRDAMYAVAALAVMNSKHFKGVYAFEKNYQGYGFDKDRDTHYAKIYWGFSKAGETLAEAKLKEHPGTQELLHTGFGFTKTKTNNSGTDVSITRALYQREKNKDNYGGKTNNNEAGHINPEMAQLTLKVDDRVFKHTFTEAEALIFISLHKHNATGEWVQYNSASHAGKVMYLASLMFKDSEVEYKNKFLEAAKNAMENFSWHSSDASMIKLDKPTFFKGEASFHSVFHVKGRSLPTVKQILALTLKDGTKVFYKWTQADTDSAIAKGFKAGTKSQRDILAYLAGRMVDHYPAKDKVAKLKAVKDKFRELLGTNHSASGTDPLATN